MDKNDIAAVKRGLGRVPGRERNHMRRSAATTVALQDPKVMHHAAGLQHTIGGRIGDVSSVELLQALTWFIEENDLWNAVFLGGNDAK